MPCADVAEALEGADAAVILTEWQAYREVDWDALAPLMRHPAWIFDGRGVVDPMALITTNLHLWRVGCREA